MFYWLDGVSIAYSSRTAGAAPAVAGLISQPSQQSERGEIHETVTPSNVVRLSPTRLRIFGYAFVRMPLTGCWTTPCKTGRLQQKRHKQNAYRWTVGWRAFWQLAPSFGARSLCFSSSRGAARPARQEASAGVFARLCAHPGKLSI